MNTTPSRTARPRRMRRGVMAAAAAVTLVAVGAVVGGCSDDDEAAATGGGTPAAGQASAEAALASGALVIDVRTPEEYAAGHIEDAQLLDVQSSQFAADVAQLDPEQTYVVYCRSGNRSAGAAQQMRAAGLEVLDGGAMDDMVSVGWPTA